MLIALSSTCIQTFSIRLASHADVLRGSSRAPDEPLRTCEASVRHAPTWSAIRHVACRAPDDPFWAGMQEVYFHSQTTQLFGLDSWINIFWPFITKGYHIGPFPRWGFCTSLQIWHELNVAWWTEQRFVCWFWFFFFLQTQGPPFFAFNQSANSFESYSQKNKGGVPAIRATEHKKIRGRKK